ncbi:hypothetical protein BKH43_02685 [Helicobacter sp. 13S00401-1]|uniref:hypothetical protein n=1 Tax=Helicobacter sp. 13S00401-1 TaxID=1905758 RepID=UPI000BA7C654|nr:hypothetical protein [Helicobacter sp. 13S00401-1]PAF51130.1 hypothetical protein BKH43_02685 [Helicobacter sp. 13S00401-1]
MSDFEITGSLDSKTLNIECHGVIESYEDFKDFKASLFSIAKSDPISHMSNPTFNILNIMFIESYPISDNVFGFLLKLRIRDKIEVNFMTDDNRVLNSSVHIHLDEKLNMKLFYTNK